MSETDYEGPADDSGVPIEADPADVEEQRREVGDPEEDDYR